MQDYANQLQAVLELFFLTVYCSIFRVCQCLLLLLLKVWHNIFHLYFYGRGHLLRHTFDRGQVCMVTQEYMGEGIFETFDRGQACMVVKQGYMGEGIF